MTNERFLVAGGTRILSREPNTRLMAIAEQVSDVYDPEGGGMCDKSPVNFIGAMLLSMLEGRQSRITQMELSVPQGIDKPIEILHDVPVSVYQRNGSYEDLGFTADEVLFKWGCGRDLGVVLNGDLPGLLLRPISNQEAHTRLTVTRLWNNQPASITDLPYRPRFSDKDMSKPILHGWEQLLFDGDVRDPYSRPAFELALRLKSAYERLVREVGGAIGRQPDETDVFFHLCRKLGIEVDAVNFYFAQDAPAKPGDDGFNSLLFG